MATLPKVLIKPADIKSGVLHFVSELRQFDGSRFQPSISAGPPGCIRPVHSLTNSYNGVRALVFDIGFFRKVCTNGLILRDAIIQFKFTHARRDLGEEIQFRVAHDRLDKLKARFGDYVATLPACPVARKDLAPFVHRVLALRPPDPLKPNTR
jgi:Domain of unknown function (DUF932)